MDKKKRNILVIVILIIMLAGAGSAGTVYYYFFSRQFNLSKTAYIYIDRDDNLDSIYSKIESTGHPKTMYGFKFQAERGNYGKTYAQDGMPSVLKTICAIFIAAFRWDIRLRSISPSPAYAPWTDWHALSPASS